MSRNLSVTIDPFYGIAASGRTSNTVPLYDADRLTLSLRTTVASGSTHTLQLSNATVVVPESIPAASWSNWTVLGQSAVALPSSITVVPELPPLGFNYARLIRSDGSAVLQIVKSTR